jgi:type VI secretion system (T6SS) VasI/EvfG family protein
MRGNILAVGLVATGFWAPTVSAQDLELQQMKACTLVQDAAARLRCYDYALSRPTTEPQLVVIPRSPTDAASQAPLYVIPQSSTAAASQAPLAANAPQAPLVAPAQSPATPKSDTFFDALLGAPSTETEGGNWQLKADKPALEDASQVLASLVSADGQSTLFLSCKAMNTEANVSTHSFLGWESMRVVYRINNNPAAESRWKASADGRGAVADNAIEFIKALADNGTLLISVFDYNDKNHDLRFNLGQISMLRFRIATICRWPSAFSDDKAVINEPVANPQPSKPKPRVQRPLNAN